MYQNKLVACLKVDGKVLREQDGTVALPWGNEYSLLIKNLNSVRVQIKVYIDGTDVTGGRWLIVGSNQDLELERYILNGNLQLGNKFKFIPRSKELEKYRGLKVDDGLIRIEYKTERVARTNINTNIGYLYYPYYPGYYYEYYPGYYYPLPQLVYNTNGGPTYGVGFAGSSGNLSPSQCANLNAVANCSSVDDSGITVPGSESHQSFYRADGFDCDPHADVLVIRLRGETGGKPVIKAVTVKAKATCSTCGKKSKGDKKFCSHCGTALVLL